MAERPEFDSSEKAGHGSSYNLLLRREPEIGIGELQTDQEVENN